MYLFGNLNYIVYWKLFNHHVFYYFIRWTCGTIERGYAPSEARELRAIASFHHPLGFAWGYIKMVITLLFE